MGRGECKARFPLRHRTETAQAVNFPRRELPPDERRHVVVKQSDRRREVVGRRAQINVENVSGTNLRFRPRLDRWWSEGTDVGSKDVVDCSKDHVLGQMNEAVAAEQQVRFRKGVFNQFRDDVTPNVVRDRNAAVYCVTEK